MDFLLGIIWIAVIIFRIHMSFILNSIHIMFFWMALLVHIIFAIIIYIVISVTTQKWPNWASKQISLPHSKDFWLDVSRELWDTYRPFVLDKYDAHPCSNTTIMADVWAAAYYSHIWSRMVAADAFQAFKESNEEHGVIGKRWDFSGI